MAFWRKLGAVPYDVAAAVVFVTGLVFYLLTAARAETFGSDTSTYFELARSLRSGQGYWFNFEPHTMYPPGFPVLLTAAMAVTGESFSALVKACIVLYYIGLAGVYAFVRMHRGPAVAATVLTLLVTSYVFYFWSTVGVHSEAAYFTATVAALLLVEVAENARRPWLRMAAHGGVAVLASYVVLLRSVGITLVAGLLLWAVLTRRSDDDSGRTRWRRLAAWGTTLAVPVLVFFAWTYWSGANQSPDADYMHSYLQQIRKEDPLRIDSPPVSPTTLAVRTIRMAGTRIENGTRTLTNVQRLPLGWKNPICVAALIVVAIGFATSLRRERGAAHCYLLAYGGMLLLYPFNEGTRYLHAVQPFLLISAIDGLNTMRQALKRTLPAAASEPGLRFAAAGLFAAVASAGLYGAFTIASNNLDEGVSRRANAATRHVSDWVRANTPDDAVIMVDQYPILHRLTGRRTRRFPLTTDPRLLRDRVLSGVDYVVVFDERQYEYYSPSTSRRFEALRALAPALFTPVHVFKNGVIYRVDQRSAQAAAHGG